MNIKLIIFTCFLILTCSIGFVCASSDLNDVNNEISLIQVEEINDNTVDNDIEIQKNVADVGNSLKDNNTVKSVDLPKDKYEGGVSIDPSFTGLNGVVKYNEYFGAPLELFHDYSFTGSESDLKYKNGIEITEDNFVIDGRGHTIDCKENARVFDIKANNVVLKNLNIVNAKQVSDLVGVVHFFNPGTVINCTFKNTLFREYGTVYFEKGGNIRNSTFIECKCYEYGGALFINGGEIDNCTFIKNIMASKEGAAVFAKGNVLINNSEFRENEGGYCGSIYCDGNLTVENTNFVDNKCFAPDGKIRISLKTPLRSESKIPNLHEIYGTEGSTIATKNLTPYWTYYEDFTALNNEIQNSKDYLILNKDYVFDQTKDSVINITKSNFVIDGTYHTISGVSLSRIFEITGKNVTLKNICLTDGYSENGGAIYFHEFGTLNNCILKNNRAVKGGSVYFKTCGTLDNCTISDNVVDVASIYFNNQPTLPSKEDDHKGVVPSNVGLLKNCNFYHNNGHTISSVYLKNGIVSGCIFIDNLGNNYGSLYMNHGTVENSNFINNVVKYGKGGALYLADGTVNNCNFIANKAGYGGASYLNNCNVNGCNFINNTACYGGGAIYVNGTIFMENTQFENNTLKNNVSDVDFEVNSLINTKNVKFSFGNPAVTDFDTLNNLVQNCKKNILKLGTDFIFNPDADSLFTEGITVDRSNFVIDGLGHTINGMNIASVFNVLGTNVTLKNINFINCYSSGNGAAAQFDGNAIIENCNFINNTAKFAGGALFIRGNGSIIDSVFSNNSARHGGVAYIASTWNVENCIFTNCTSLGNGATIASSNNGIVKNSLFKDNNAGLNGIVAGYKNVVVEGCTFDNNTAFFDGIVFANGDVNATNSKFTNNHARSGGAICSNGLNIDNCLFLNNTASNCGGAVCSRGMTTINNSIFDGNSALVGGAVFLSSYSKIINKINNSTFNNNVAVNGGAVTSNTMLIIDNSHFNNNSAEYDGAIQVYNSGKVNNCDFSNNSAKNGIEIFIKKDLE